MDEEGQDERVTVVLLRTLARLVDLYQRYTLLISVGPNSRSRAVRDIREQLGETPLTFAAQGWSVGYDHAFAWYRLLRDARFQPIAAHATLVRAALEGAATCRWLVDPMVTSIERRNRGANAQLDDYRQRAAFEKAARVPAETWQQEGKSGAHRYGDLVMEMQRLGIERHMPGATELVRLYAIPRDDEGVDGEWLYRALSAMAHHKQWGLMLSERGESMVVIGVPGVHRGLFSSDDRLTVVAANAAVETLEVALREFEDYHGRSMMQPPNTVH